MGKHDAITNMDNQISWHQIEERIEWLTNEHEDYDEDGPPADEVEELANLCKLVDQFSKKEIANEPTLIRDSYFTRYAEELAEEIDSIPRKQATEWPFRHIDWEAAADELKHDYSQVDFDGETYWYRA